MTAPLNARFIHRQTLPNAFRFSTTELGDLEAKIAGAADRALAIELAVFDEVTAAVAGAQSFDSAFPGLGDGSGLEELRRLFLVKGFTVWQERLLRRLLEEGRDEHEVAEMRLADLDGGEVDCREYLQRRGRLGLPTDGGARLAVLPNGSPLEAESMRAYLRRARMTRVSMEANTALCCGLHATRYPERQEVIR